MASIKKRMGATAGRLNDRELRALFLAVQADLAAMKTTLTSVRTDVVNIQTTANALVSDVANLRANTGGANNSTTVGAAAATVGSSAPSALTLTD
jgi:hypothetical protein